MRCALSHAYTTYTQCDGCHTTTLEEPPAVIVQHVQCDGPVGHRPPPLDLCADCREVGYWICCGCAEVHARGPCPWQEEHGGRSR